MPKTFIFNYYLRDLRSVTPCKERADTFDQQAEAYFQYFSKCYIKQKVGKKPYMRILRNHVGHLMKFALEHFNWGYDVFSCTAGEHINNIIKTMEITGTCLDQERFQKVISSC